MQFKTTFDMYSVMGIHSKPDCPKSLQIPAIGDSVALLQSKLIALGKAVQAGQSIAVATRFAAVPLQQRNATENAVKQMPPDELEWWQAYNDNRCQLPEINWVCDHDMIPISPRPLRTARRRAEALNYLYKTDQAKPGHSVWFTKNQLIYLPLVKAMARIIGAERDLLGGQCTLSAIQLADLQSLNGILSTSGRILKANRSKIFPSDIGQAQRILGSQREELRSLLEVGRRNEKCQCCDPKRRPRS
jgi:hypothetical protein